MYYFLTPIGVEAITKINITYKQHNLVFNNI